MDVAYAEVLATNNRLKHLYRISDIFDELVAAAKGEVRAKITTAQVLEPEELQDIKDGLSKQILLDLKRTVTAVLQAAVLSCLSAYCCSSPCSCHAAEELLKPGEKLLVEQAVSQATTFLACPSAAAGPGLQVLQYHESKACIPAAAAAGGSTNHGGDGSGHWRQAHRHVNQLQSEEDSAACPASHMKPRLGS